jgi:REP element-mobilizing transposase RayT
MDEIDYPIAFITWTTYGTWLPGDERGWVLKGNPGVQSGIPELYRASQQQMTEQAVVFSQSQRRMVDATIRKHCEIRHWNLLALNVRTNHIHLVVKADVSGWEVMKQLKSWATRALQSTEPKRKRWWTRRGYVRYLEDDDAIENAVRYTLEGQSVAQDNDHAPLD